MKILSTLFICFLSINISIANECQQTGNMEITCHILMRDSAASALLTDEEVARKQSEISKMRAIIEASRYEVNTTAATVIYRMKIESIERELRPMEARCNI